MRIPALTIAMLLAAGAPAPAQDIPGIELCTAEKDMVRRTSCLQSNINFLQRLIGREAMAARRNLDAAQRQIDELTRTVVELQKTVAGLQARKPEPAKDAPAK